MTLLLVVWTLPGCLLVAGAAVGAAAVVILSEDTAAVSVRGGHQTTYDAALSELAFREALVEEADPVIGRIVAEVDASKVTIQITSLDTERTDVTVTARKLATVVPNLKLAQDLAKSIQNRMPLEG